MIMATEQDIARRFSPLFITIGITSIFCNGLLCHILRKLGKLQTISYKLILIQGIADVCAGIVLLISETAMLTPIDEDTFDKVCVFSRITCDAVCQFSGTMFLIVAIDRFIHMKYLTKYNTMMSEKRAAMLVFNNIGSSLSMAVVNVFGVLHDYYNTSHLVMNFFAVTLYSTTFLIYYRAYVSMSTRISQINTENSVRASKRPSRNKEFARAVALILVVFAGCLTPFVIASTVKIVIYCPGCGNNENILIAFYSTRALVCLTSTLNAVIFIYINRELRRYLLRPVGPQNQSINTT